MMNAEGRAVFCFGGAVIQVGRSISTSNLSTVALEDVLKVQMLVALATEVAATEAKPAVAGDKTLTLR
jgi:hypothetical protein